MESMTRLREDVVGLDATIIMHPQIWRASGHVDTFADPMVDCLLTKKRFRADQVDPQSGMVYFYSGAKDEGTGKEVSEEYSVLIPPGKPPESARKVAAQYYAARGVASPTLLGERAEKVENSVRYNPENGALLTEPRLFNLMFKTYAGPIESEENVVLSAAGNGAGDFRAVQERGGDLAAEGAVRHLPDRQGVSQRGHSAQFHLPLARVRADGAGVFHQAR